MYNRTLVNIDVTRKTAGLVCERCGLEEDVDIGDDLADDLTLAAICRYLRDDHRQVCDQVIDAEMDEALRVYGGEG